MIKIINGMNMSVFWMIIIFLSIWGLIGCFRSASNLKRELRKNTKKRS